MSNLIQGSGYLLNLSGAIILILDKLNILVDDKYREKLLKILEVIENTNYYRLPFITFNYFIESVINRLNKLWGLWYKYIEKYSIVYLLYISTYFIISTKISFNYFVAFISFVVILFIFISLPTKTWSVICLTFSLSILGFYFLFDELNDQTKLEILSKGILSIPAILSIIAAPLIIHSYILETYLGPPKEPEEFKIFKKFKRVKFQSNFLKKRLAEEIRQKKIKQYQYRLKRLKISNILNSKSFITIGIWVGFSFIVSISCLYIGELTCQEITHISIRFLVINAITDGITLYITLKILKVIVSSNSFIKAIFLVVLDLVIAGTLAIGSIYIGLLLTKDEVNLFQAIMILIGRDFNNSYFEMNKYFLIMHSTFVPSIMYLSLITLAWMYKFLLTPIHGLLKLIRTNPSPVTLTSSFLILLGSFMLFSNWLISWISSG